jgi:hypothetical protein
MPAPPVRHAPPVDRWDDAWPENAPIAGLPADEGSFVGDVVPF